MIRRAGRVNGFHDADLFAGEHAGRQSPGQYSFGDFVKVGAPFTVVVAIVSVLLVPIFLPFYSVIHAVAFRPLLSRTTLQHFVPKTGRGLTLIS